MLNVNHGYNKISPKLIQDGFSIIGFLGIRLLKSVRLINFTMDQSLFCDSNLHWIH